MRSITKITITIIVVLIMTVGVFIPITSGLEDNIKSVEQNTDYRFILKENNLNLSVDYVEPGVYTINGREYTSANNYTVIIGTGIYIYMYSNNYSILDANNNFFKLRDTPGNVITIENGVYSYVYQDTEYTGSVDTLLYPSYNGDYGAFTTSEFNLNVDVEDPIYLVSNKPSPLPKFGLTVVNGAEVRSEAILAPWISDPLGEYTDEVSVEVVSTLSEDGLSRNYTEFNVTAGTQEFIPMVYAPIKYHVDDSTAQATREIVNVLPLVILIGLLIAAGYAMINSMGKKTDI